MEFGSEIIKVLDYIGQKLGIAFDWSSETIMPYLQELIQKVVRYEIATSMTWILIFSLILYFSCHTIKKLMKKVKYSDDRTMLGVMFAVICVIGAIVISNQIFDIIEAVTLPEMTFYNYVQSISYRFK